MFFEVNHYKYAGYSETKQSIFSINNNLLIFFK